MPGGHFMRQNFSDDINSDDTISNISARYVLVAVDVWKSYAAKARNWTSLITLVDRRSVIPVGH